MLNPINHSKDPASPSTTASNPTSSLPTSTATAPDRRGGWTWYTGSAGWLYRAAVEGILGIRRQGDKLMIQPVLPKDWDGFSATLTIEGKPHVISVTKNAENGEPVVSVNNTVTKNAHEGVLL
jgi:cyclic beta-1,2-glucan synthetase